MAIGIGNCEGTVTLGETCPYCGDVMNCIPPEKTSGGIDRGEHYRCPNCGARTSIYDMSDATSGEALWIVSEEKNTDATR